jgi:heat shock protein HtpX
MRRYRRDAGLSLRIVLSLVGLLLLYVPLLLWPVGAVAFAVIVFGRALFGRRDLTELEDAPAELRSLVDRLCGLSGVPPPRVAVLETDLPNTHTLGNAFSGCTIVVSRGLLRELNLDELEAVVAHELAHVAHRDALVMVVVSFPARMFRGVALALSRTRLIPLAFAAWVATAVAAIPLMAFSRYRELVADRGAALLTGRPEALMSALQKLSAGVARIPGEDLRAVAGRLDVAARLGNPVRSRRRVLRRFATRNGDVGRSVHVHCASARACATRSSGRSRRSREPGGSGRAARLHGCRRCGVGALLSPVYVL